VGAFKLGINDEKCQMFKSLLLRHAVFARRNDEAIQGEGRMSYGILRNR